jgi:pimeloyl-ACP methyl ester carboxylesterase
VLRFLVQAAIACTTLSSLAPAARAQSLSGAPGPRAGVTMQVISFASDPPGRIRQAPGGGRILTPAVLYQPAAGANTQAPAIVMLDQGPGSHPLEAGQATRFAGERLAAMGYTVLSIYSGQERGFARQPFAETALAIRGALDCLEIAGHEKFVLAGQGYGAIAVAHYLATEPDTLMDNGGEKRVKAALLINPLTELRRYPRADLLQHYEARVAQAEASVAAGRGGIPQLEPGRDVGAAHDPWLLAGPFIAPAVNWLDYWGPQAAQRNADVLRRLALPTFVAVGARDPAVSLQTLRALNGNGAMSLKDYPDADAQFSGAEDTVTQDMARWLAAQQLAPGPRVVTRVVDVATGGGRTLQGLFYAPENVDPRRPALILIGGRTADTLQSSTHWMGVRLAAKGLAVFAPGLRISGVAGFQASNFAEVAEDIGHWVDRAASLGYRRIVLTGHSNGGVWISHYMALTQDPRVVGMAYFAPTRDSPTFARAEEGAQYERHLQTARDAIARGDGMRVVIGLMTAQAWMDNNGPVGHSMHTLQVREFDRPGLSITGARDPLMTPEFVAEFRRAYRGPLTEIRYPDGSHGLRENKPRLGDDVAAWVQATFP